MDSQSTSSKPGTYRIWILLAGVVVAVIAGVVFLYVSELNTLLAEKINLPPALSKLADAYATVVKVVDFITNLLPQR